MPTLHERSTTDGHRAPRPVGQCTETGGLHDAGFLQANLRATLIIIIITFLFERLRLTPLPWQFVNLRTPKVDRVRGLKDLNPTLGTLRMVRDWGNSEEEDCDSPLRRCRTGTPCASSQPRGPDDGNWA